jgi:WD40 repeat protein
MRTKALALGMSALIATSLWSSAAARPSSAPLEGEGEGLKLVANLATGSGTDMEFTTIKGKEYGFVASRTVTGGITGGLNVVSVDDPARPKLVAKLPCNLNQGDIQISHDKKTVIMAADSAGSPDSCLMVGKLGFMTIDISNPRKPKPVGVAEISRGSHNVTAHPNSPYVYNSDSDQANRGEIQIWSIANPAKPELVNTIMNPTHSPHDISFNTDGSLMVTAARTAVHLYDTSDPENPQLLGATVCPGCYLAHDAKFTPDSKWVIAGDEAAGGAAYPCPGGALYFYEIVQERGLVLRGVYEPGEVVFATEGQGGPASCTSHVFDVSDDGKTLAISWYSAGTRYLDITNMTGVTFGENGNGVKELGWFIPDGGSSWSSKFHKGPYIYSNDINRGLDVYKITAE